LAAKIQVTGTILTVRKIINEQSQLAMVIVEIKTGGTNAPKGLPAPSKEIHFACVVKPTLFQRIKDHATENSRSVRGLRVSIKGELCMEMAADLIGECQLGVVGFEMDPLGDKKPAEPKPPAPPKPPRPKLIPVNNIALDITLYPKSPSEEEVAQEIEHYQQSSEFSKPVYLDITKSGYRLRKGYTQFLAAKKLDLEKIPCFKFKDDVPISWSDFY